jgi:DtxR family Mn-dependent transcriptional regulator
MIDPLNALLIGLLVLAVISLTFWPRIGLGARWKRWTQDTERVQIENALKHIYDCEYKNISCTIHSIAGNLSIKSDRAAKLVSRLETIGLLTSNGEVLQLTPQGRSYALRVIRVHRLWERYLADETGLKEMDWHEVAEEKEHSLTPEQADKLAAQIGNPIFDPHGDPIPNSEGQLPELDSQPLTSLKSGELGVIVHIEDEPKSIYSQLVAQGLHAGMQVKMIESNNERIKFIADLEECVLAPLFAANIAIKPIQPELEIKSPFRTLSSLKIGEEGIVIGISKACRGQQRRRLMDFGVVPGTKIIAELRSASGDPVAYQIRGAKVALRKPQADLIYIKDSDKENN